MLDTLQAANHLLDKRSGLDIKEEDPYLALAERANQGSLEAATPGSFLVDIVPVLKYIAAWVPGASFQKKVAKWKKFARVMIEVPFQVTKANMVSEQSNRRMETKEFSKRISMYFPAGGDLSALYGLYVS